MDRRWKDQRQGSLRKFNRKRTWTLHPAAKRSGLQTSRRDARTYLSVGGAGVGVPMFSATPRLQCVGLRTLKFKPEKPKLRKPLRPSTCSSRFRVCGQEKEGSGQSASGPLSVWGSGRGVAARPGGGGGRVRRPGAGSEPGWVCGPLRLALKAPTHYLLILALVEL